MIAAGAAAIALGFSAWTGFYQVQVSKDQLSQSREESEKEEKAQAALVSAWTQEGKNVLTTGYFLNRSPDPIAQVRIALGNGDDYERTVGVFRGDKKEVLLLGDVPPCSMVTISPVAAKEALGIMGKSLDTKWGIVGFSFVDTIGQRWAKPSNKPLQKLELFNLKEEVPKGNVVDPFWTLIYGDKEIGGERLSRPGSRHSSLPAPTPWKECGADSQ